MNLRCSKCGRDINYFAPYGKIVWYECGCGSSWQQGTEKPPIGIIPRKLWYEQRFQNLADAINSYSAASRPIPREWLEEYNELAERFA